MGRGERCEEGRQKLYIRRFAGFSGRFTFDEFGVVDRCDGTGLEEHNTHIDAALNWHCCFEFTDCAVQVDVRCRVGGVVLPLLLG